MRANYKYSATLSHCLNDQYSGHYRFFREVAHKKRLIHGYILHSNDIISTFFNDFIQQKEGIPVRKHLFDLIYIIQRNLIGIIFRGSIFRYSLKILFLK